MKKLNFKSILAIALTVMMVLSVLPMAVFADEATATKITSVDQLVSGQYVLASTNNKAVTTFEKDWYLAADIAPVDGKLNTVSSATVVTVTVDGGKITLKDSTGKFIGKGDSNKMANAETVWAVTCDADGAFTILVDGDADGRMLCYAAASNSLRFRQYRPTSIEAAPQNYVTTFNFYKVEGTVTPDAPTTPETPEKPESNDPAADSTLTVKEAIDLGASKEHNTYTEGKYYVSGKITEVYNTTYGNMKITDDAGNILTIYGTYSADGSTRYDKMATQPVAGDTVKIYGIIGQYSGAAQVKNGWIVEHTAGSTQPETPEKPEVNDPAADSTLSVKDAIALGESKEHNVYTEGKYYVVGEIVEIYNTTYGNMKIKDAEGNILTIYGTYSADGSTRFDKMEKQPAVGDTVKVYGIIGQYNKVAQVKNGWIIETSTPSSPDTGDAMIVMIPAMLLAGVAVLCVVSRKRRFN